MCVLGTASLPAPDQSGTFWQQLPGTLVVQETHFSSTNVDDRIQSDLDSRHRDIMILISNSLIKKCY